ncbi:MAG: nuclear transport factor 2 family protein [Halioglobus sp.]
MKSHTNSDKRMKLSIGWSLVLAISFMANSVYADQHKQALSPDMFGLDSAAAKTVIAFHTALQDGDANTARRLLSDKVTIYEGKGVERSADEYASHHMPGDMAFLKALKPSTLEHQVKVLGAVAYSVSKTQMMGSYKDEVIDQITVETMILAKEDETWRIIHIHWSQG